MSEFSDTNWEFVGGAFYRNWRMDQWFGPSIFTASRVTVAVRYFDPLFRAAVYTAHSDVHTAYSNVVEQREFSDLASAQAWCDQVAAPMVVAMRLAN